MKKLILIAITAVLSLLVITVLAQTEGGQGSGTSGQTSGKAQESAQQKYLRAVEEKRPDRRLDRRPYGRSRRGTRGYDGRTVSGSMQDVVNYLVQKDEQNTRRMEALEATVASLEKELKRNSGIERRHWSKVGELEDKVSLLIRAERKRRRAEDAGEESEVVDGLAGEETE
ncbi:MAG: hypothetical protein ACYTE5_06130 [Planctomycetota bacterium]|jgi:hypothetical protein